MAVEYALLIDYEYCSGCQTCEVACKEEHDFPVGKWGIRVLDDGPWKKIDEGEGGNTFNWNKIPVPTDLCDLCAERRAEGKVPSCQLHCLAQVIKVLPLDEMAQRMVELGGKKVTVFMP